MDKKPNIKVKEYFDIHNKYTTKYGKGRTIILMQIGSFHETYCTDTLGPDLKLLSQQLEIICTKKNKQKEISKSNPYMLGFPTPVLGKYLQKLMDLNYTVIVIDQVTKPPNPKRQITGIYSPGTWMEIENNSSLDNYLVSIVLEEITDPRGGIIIAIGMSSIDLTTGNSCFHEAFSKKDDPMFSLDDTNRFLKSYPPKEIIYYQTSSLINNFTQDEILSYLSINSNMIYEPEINKIKTVKKIDIQNKILNNIFTNHGFESIIEYIGMERTTWARLAFVILMDYIWEHNNKITAYLKIPKLYAEQHFLYLGNNALTQLNVLDSEKYLHNGKGIKSLFDVINETSTALGRRYLRSCITSPLININEIQTRYDAIKILRKNNKWKDIENILVNILDLERLTRKLSLGKLNPWEFFNLCESFNSVKDLLIESQNINIKIPLFEKNDIELLEQLNEYINNTFLLENMLNLNTNDIKKSFFQYKIYPEIDELQNKLNFSENFLTLLSDELEKYVQDKKYFTKNNKKLINIKYNERNGHYLLLTTRRCKLLKKGLDTKKNIKIGEYKLQISELKFEQLPKSANVKILCPEINKKSSEIVIFYDKISQLVKEKYIEIQNQIYQNNIKLFTRLVIYVSYIDFIKSGAKISKRYNYKCPILQDNAESFFTAKELRHPIVERLPSQTEYKAHDIGLGGDNNDLGILLYGVNSSGKSTLMKSIGLNIIMAQIGYFVPAAKLILSPYKSLFTRITGTDNIFKGMSSFMVEIIELRSILRRNTENTLVICDEICRGTEVQSANIIVLYMIEQLAKSKTCFISATHLHKLIQSNIIKTLNDVNPYHIDVTFDEKEDKLIFDRQLKPGNGRDYYGLQIAKYVMHDKLFDKRTKEIENSFYKSNEKLIDSVIKTKKSLYNAKVSIDKCSVCNTNKNLETHHINWQKDCKNGFINAKPHIPKNHKSNLMIVCTKCHDKIDSGIIIVDGWEDTSDGPKLKIKKNKKKKYNNKYNLQQVEIINKLKTKNYNKKQAKKILNTNYDIKISVKTISKIWKGMYKINE